MENVYSARSSLENDPQRKIPIAIKHGASTDKKASVANKLEGDIDELLSPVQSDIDRRDQPFLPSRFFYFAKPEPEPDLESNNPLSEAPEKCGPSEME